MIPVILVSGRKLDTKKFVDSLRVQEKIPTYHTFSFEPESTIITIDQIREIHNFIVKSQFPKIVVIHDFDTAKIETQNAFLKTLEEHSTNTFFVLTCTSADGFLPTIQSRCQIVRLNAIHQTKTKENFLEYPLVEQALDASAQIKKDAFLNTLNNLIVSLHVKINEDLERSKLTNLRHYSTNIRTAFSIKILMKDYNIQPEYAFDQLLLDIYKK